MQRRHWKIGLISIMIAISNMAFTPNLAPAPDPNPPPGPDRFSIIAVDYTAYQWNLLTWKRKEFACSVITDHEGMPLPEEVYRDCGETIYKTWITQPPCVIREYKNCVGYYAVLIDSQKKEKEISMMLAPASTWISLEDCEPVLSTSTNICETTHTLVITALFNCRTIFLR